MRSSGWCCQQNHLPSNCSCSDDLNALGAFSYILGRRPLRRLICQSDLTEEFGLQLQCDAAVWPSQDWCCVRGPGLDWTGLHVSLVCRLSAGRPARSAPDWAGLHPSGINSILHVRNICQPKQVYRTCRNKGQGGRKCPMLWSDNWGEWGGWRWSVSS